MSLGENGFFDNVNVAATLVQATTAATQATTAAEESVEIERHLHGREYWYTALGGHQEVRIEWRESILYASGLKRSIANDQAALPAKAGS